MELARLLLIVLLLADVGSATAGTLLFLESEEGDYIGGGITRRRTTADGVFTVSRNYDNGVSIRFDGSPLSNYWMLDFAGPMETALAPGTYEGAYRFPFQDTVAPGLSVSGEHRGCHQLTGRFVVLEVTYGPGGEVLTFAADFEQHCEGMAPGLFGSIRINTGDAGCSGQPDGTPCEDHDACTATSACQSAVCQGGGAAACGGSTETCVQTALCDPQSAACVGGEPVPDGTACDDGSSCTIADSCQDGVCTPGAGPSCDDGDPCTADGCDGAGGCVHTALSCWSLTGITRAKALKILGLPRTQGFTGHLALPEDGTYLLSVPGNNASCLLPVVETGTRVPGRRGRRALQVGTLDELADAASDCLGHPLTLASYRTWVKLTRGETRLRGASRVVGSLELGGEQIEVRAVTKFTGAVAAP